MCVCFSFSFFWPQLRVHGTSQTINGTHAPCSGSMKYSSPNLQRGLSFPPLTSSLIQIFFFHFDFSYDSFLVTFPVPIGGEDSAVSFGRFPRPKTELEPSPLPQCCCQAWPSPVINHLTFGPLLPVRRTAPNAILNGLIALLLHHCP